MFHIRDVDQRSGIGPEAWKKGDYTPSLFRWSPEDHRDFWNGPGPEDAQDLVVEETYRTARLGRSSQRSRNWFRPRSIDPELINAIRRP